MSELPSLWPLDHARDVHSQSGEDGVVEALLNALPERNNWVVEFGAWDGLHLSNSRYFITQHGFSGVLIEGDSQRHADLDRLYRDRQDVHTINTFVTSSGTNTLDAILASTPIPRDFDYLSIDIDGNDYYVFRSLENYRPKVVCIEFNPSVPSEVDFVQPDDFATKQGCGIRTLTAMAKAKGYELAALTQFNAFFVPQELFPLLDIEDNSIQNLRRDTSAVTYVFSGYDGTVFVVGGKELPWHRIPMKLATRQELPTFLRKFPLDYGPGRKAAFYGYYATRHPVTLARKAARRLRRTRRPA